MSGDSPADQIVAENEPETISWKFRPARESPEKVTIVWVLAVCMAIFGWIIFKNVLMSCVGFAMIVGPTAEFWLGSKFKLDARGASSTTGFSMTQIDWDKVKRVKVGSKTIKLSPLEGESRMEAFRGVTLKLEEGLRSQVIGFIDQRVGTDVRES